jgi:predicted ATPase
MFTKIQALRFRSLRSVDQPLGLFRALVGPNGSGKTTFLDVLGLLGDLTRNRGDVLETLQERQGWCGFDGGRGVILNRALN